MEQNKNFTFFVAASVLILVGWAILQHQLWPPQPKKTAPPAETKNQDKDGKEAPQVKQVRWGDLPLPVRDALYLMGSPAPVGGFVLAGLIELEKLPPVVKAAPPKEPSKTVVIGGPLHNLEVTLTSKGAGVQKLVLNKFLAADWRGQPDPDGSKLELIQDDPVTASFLMFHYPDEKAANPVFGLDKLDWKLESKPPSPDEENQEVTFSTPVPEMPLVRITRTYRLKPGTYHLEMSLAIQDLRKRGEVEEPRPVWFRYQLAGSHGMPIEGEWYTSTFRSAVIGLADASNYPSRDLETSDRISHRAGGERVPRTTLGTSIVQYAGTMTQYFASLIVTDDTQPRLPDGSDGRQFLAWARPTQESREEIAILERFDGNLIELRGTLGLPAIFPALPRVRKHLEDAAFKPKERVTVSFRVNDAGKKIVSWIRRGHVLRPFFDDLTVRVNSQDLNLMPGDRVEHNFLLYHGPAKVRLLSQFSGDKAIAPELVNRYAYKLNLRMLTDYGRFYWWSDLLTACTNLMHFLLYYLRFLGDGMSIILLTILVRSLMFPISRRQAYFSVKMQELAPEMKKLQEKYKNDLRARQEATMELYRKHNVHPLGGCLPLLLQMPIFIGLYFALGESIHFRLAKFLWMDNLAAPDMLFYWGEGIPIISDPDNQGTVLGFLYLGPYFNLLPIFAIGLMIAQQIIMTPPPQDEQQAMQFKMMRYMMILIGIMFYKIAAGLCMYIIVSTLWALGERRLLPKKKPVAETPAAPTNGPPTPRSGPSGRKQPPKPGKKKNEGIKKMSDWWQEVLKQARKK